MNSDQSSSLKQNTRLYSWIALAILVVIYISSFVDRQIIAVLATQIRESLGLSNTEIGVLYGPAFSWIYAIMGIFMGRLADQMSRKRVILVGLTIWSLMTFASGFANSLTFLITARIFVGVSQAALSPAVYSILSDYFKPSQRATVFSIYASGIFVGVGLSFLIGGSVATAYDWRFALKTVGLPGIGIAILGAFLLKEPPRKTQKEGVSGYTFFEVLMYILKKKTVRYHLAGFSLLALSGYTILAFISTVLTDVFDAPEKIASYGWFMLATGVSVNLSGWAADKLAKHFGEEKRFVMGIFAALAGLPFYYFGFFAGSAATAFLLIGIGNVMSSSYNGVAAALIQYFVKSDMRGLAGAVYLFVVSIVGFGIGPPVTGWLIDNYFNPSEALMLVFVVCGVLSSICFLLAMRSYHADVVN
jgi:MFS family permease